MNIILASQSPRRRELLTQIGLPFRVVVSQADETIEPRTDAQGNPVLPGPGEMVELLSRRKAEAVRKQAGEDALIVAADTVVAVEEQILGKPGDAAEAVAMLEELSGRTHHVYTGVTVQQGDKACTRSECTAVHFRTLSQEEIQAYVATGEPLDKAGAYGIQGRGALLVDGIQGDYSNVVGLPLCLLGRMLAEEFQFNVLG